MQKKERYSLNDLFEIMTALRGDNGCPWDKAQTHDSIKFCAVEEAWEVIDTIDKKDDRMLANELGDLLLQVIFHSQIASERGSFAFDDVLYEICNKLISRHTHVFGADTAEDGEKALITWEKNKTIEKGLKSHTEAMNDVPRVFPALLRAEKIQKKAAKAGFDWDHVSEVFAKVREELLELEEANSRDNKHDIVEEFGDLLFAVSNIGRFIDVECEMALNEASNKFITRFATVEQLANSQNKLLEDMNFEEKDELWEVSKRILKRS